MTDCELTIKFDRSGDFMPTATWNSRTQLTSLSGSLYPEELSRVSQCVRILKKDCPATPKPKEYSDAIDDGNERQAHEYAGAEVV